MYLRSWNWLKIALFCTCMYNWHKEQRVKPIYIYIYIAFVQCAIWQQVWSVSWHKQVNLRNVYIFGPHMYTIADLPFNCDRVTIICNMPVKPLLFWMYCFYFNYSFDAMHCCIFHLSSWCVNIYLCIILFRFGFEDNSKTENILNFNNF